MAYNNYYPQYFQPSVYPNQAQMQSPTPSSGSNGITWVQGENAAKSYPVGAGQSVLLMDSESSVMYIKSTDQSGMPLPLRIFDYSERNTGHAEPAGVAKTVDYVSREEFDEFKEDVRRSIKGVRRPTLREQEDEK